MGGQHAMLPSLGNSLRLCKQSSRGHSTTACTELKGIAECRTTFSMLAVGLC